MKEFSFGAGPAVLDKQPPRKKILPQEKIVGRNPEEQLRLKEEINELIGKVETLQAKRKSPGLVLNLKKKQDQVVEQLASLEEQEKEVDRKIAAPDTEIDNKEIEKHVMAKGYPKQIGPVVEEEEIVPQFGRQPGKSQKIMHDPYRADKAAHDGFVIPPVENPGSRREYSTGELYVPKFPEKNKADENKAALEKKTAEGAAPAMSGYGRRPKRIERKFNPDRADMAIYDRLVGDSGAKRAPRGFTPQVTEANEVAQVAREADNPDNLPREKLDKLRHPDPSETMPKKAEEIIDGRERKKKNENFWQKAGSVLGNPTIQKQILKTGVSSVASILGVKSFYDVPAYFKQRYDVRGNIFGVGKGKGLAGSVEDLIGANRESRKAREAIKMSGIEGEFGNSRVGGAIDDLNKRLAKTKEGSTKGSEQRKMLAKLLRANRHEEMQSKETRKKELENILDNYTNTKVSGIQAVRETLNTACVASGAISLRGIVYGGLAFYEKMESMRREAKGEAVKKGPNAKAEEITLQKVFTRGLKDTRDGINLRTGRNKKEKAFAAVKAGGTILRFVGIAAGMELGGHAYHNDLDKIINAFEGKESFVAAGHNFIANADKYRMMIPNLINSAHNLASAIPHLPGAVQANEYNPQPPSSPFAAAAVLHHPAAADTSGGLQSMTQSHTAAAENFPVSPPPPEVPYQGGNSVWDELKHQLSARFGKGFEDLSEADKNEEINTLANRITGNPEFYGLPADQDFTKLNKADLEKIPWNKFFGPEEGPAPVVHNLHETLTDRSGKHVTPFGGSGSEVDGAAAEKTELPDQESANSADFFASRGVHNKLAELAEKAKQLDGHPDPTKRDLIFNEISEARETIKRVTGGLLVYENGDWNVKMPDGESINVFHGQGTGAEELAGAGETQPIEPIRQGVGAAIHQPSAFHRPSLGYQDVAAHNAAVPEHQAGSVASHETAAAAEPEHAATLDIKNPKEITGAFTDVEAARHLAEKSGTVDLRNVNSITPKALEAMCGKTDGYIILTGLDADKMDDAAYAALAHLKESCTVGTNDLVEKGFAHWQDAQGGKIWAVDEQHMPTPDQEAPVASNVLNDASVARHLAENPGTVDLKNTTSISKEALEALSNKTSGRVVLTGLKADNMTDDILRSVAHLKEKLTVEMNPAADQRFAAWEQTQGGRQWAVDDQHVPTPGQPEVATGNALNDAEAVRHLTANAGTVDLKNFTSISKEALKELGNRNLNRVVLTGLPADKMSNDFFQSIENLRAKVTVELNPEAEKHLAAWEQAQGNSLWEKNDNFAVNPQEHAAPVAENIPAPEISHQAAADFAAQAHENPFGVYHEVKPDFAAKYSPAEQENITAYINSEIKERNELLNVLKEYQNKYGDRPQFADFRRMMESRVAAQNGSVEKILAGVTDPKQDFSHAFVQEVGTGGSRLMAENEAEIYSAKANLISPEERQGNDFDQLHNRQAAAD